MPGMTNYPKQKFRARRLRPPRIQTCAEVRLCPRGHGDVAVHDGCVRQRQGQRCGATHHLAVLVVLRAVAGAAKPVRGNVPRHGAAQVRAHGADSEVLDPALCRDDPRGVTLQTLNELAVVGPVSLLPTLQGHRIARLVAAHRGAAATAAHIRVEVVGKGTEQHKRGHGGRRHDDEVHQGAALHVRHKARVLPACLHGDRGLGTISAYPPGGSGSHEGIGEDVGASNKRHTAEREAATPPRHRGRHGGGVEAQIKLNVVLRLP
mmetsp:Transcript_108732/g.272504  ORF Transcript_108732/g.272504 Transcript_108732/m.272504 type:complete len:263 (-) Transcript_108732:2-790(-)